MLSSQIKMLQTLHIPYCKVLATLLSLLVDIWLSLYLQRMTLRIFYGFCFWRKCNWAWNKVTLLSLVTLLYHGFLALLHWDLGFDSQEKMWCFMESILKTFITNYYIYLVVMHLEYLLILPSFCLNSVPPPPPPHPSPPPLHPPCPLLSGSLLVPAFILSDAPTL